MISIFGSNVSIATSGKTVTDYQCNFEEIMASKVGVPPLKGQISKGLNELKVKVSDSFIN